MAAWGGLCVDLVDRILAHLPCLAHRAAFGAVCVNWRAASAHHPPPPQLPWLLLPATLAEAPGFFCILCRDTHRAFLPDDVRDARCCGSHPGGWLVLALQPQRSGFALHNLHSGERLEVPDRLYTVDGIDGTNMIVLGAALSPAPTVDGAYLAVVLDRCASPIAFWFPRMAYLSLPMPPEPHERALCEMFPHARVDDVIYFAGYGLEGFHVVTDTEEVLVYDPEFAPNDTLTAHLVTYRFPDHEVNAEPGSTVSRYLLDVFGELVMVVRYVSMEGDNTTWIRAYRLRVGPQAGNHGDRQAYWEETWFGGNSVVMLGRCSSMAFFSPAAGLDGLYFLDDAKSFGDVMAALRYGPLFPCMDMGRCTVDRLQHVVGQLLDPIFPIRPPSLFSPAVWFFH